LPRYSPHRITRGPLKGHYYKTERGYRAALDKFFDKDIQREQRYGELKQAFILQKGAGYARRNNKRFNDLYRKASKKHFDPCPPVYNGDTKNENQAPYAYLLDFIGVRPIDEFGWRCIGDSPSGKGA